MNLDLPVPVKDQKEKQNSLIEVVNSEKQLWGLVHSKGLLHTDVQNFYRKVRSTYEKIILNDHEVVELQDVEYSMWKLHYKHIDEFRKRIRKSSASSDNGKPSTPKNVANVMNNMDSHIEGFKSFLSEATEFYQDLIAKLRRSCGLSEEPLYCKKAGLPLDVDVDKLHKCQFSCHRFLVCLGDLARYSELCKKSDFGNRNWSFAASYYFKATMIWPDGGNPQNQLALLATYVGDDFLALYHCVRSLAVKEPFPDAWNNLILLFEKNRLSPLDSLSSEADFDFLKPSERSVSQIESQSIKDPPTGNGLEATEHVSSAKNDLWPLFIRLISFFFIESSLEHFPCTFASTVRELEALVTLEDTKLKAELESYQHMDSARTGPYRALQSVSILIFVIHSLKESPEQKESKEKTNTQKTMLTQLALTATFIFMGRLLERCLKSNFLDCCPILPSVLVFVEWLACMIDEVEETCGNDEKVTSTMSYFFGTFIDFLNRLRNHENEVNSIYDHTVLWEDFELRGFAPIADAHMSLDFETHLENLSDSSSGNVCRAHRIFQSSMKIMERSKDSRKWFVYDKLKRKFYTEESEREIAGGNQSHPCVKGKFFATEEEEVILFKPITRYNSAPICTSITTTDQISTEGWKDEKTSSDECLRRASSLLIGNKPSKQPEPLLKESPMHPAGHPSLSAWVLDKESLNVEREKGGKDFSKNGLSPIEEIPSHFSGLSLSETDQDSIFGYSSPPPYLPPIPSAPLLPDDAIWYGGNSSNFSEPMNSEVTNGILGASPHISRIPGLIDQHPPVGMMSSSEWLHHYTSNQNISRPFYSPGNFNGHDASRFDVFDQWGNVLASNQMVYMESPRLLPCPPLTYGADEHRREKLFLGYQRLSPYVCGGGTELRVEQPPLLHYLKEREWQLQKESQVKGPTYTGN